MKPEEVKRRIAEYNLRSVKKNSHALDIIAGRLQDSARKRTTIGYTDLALGIPIASTHSEIPDCRIDGNSDWFKTPNPTGSVNDILAWLSVFSYIVDGFMISALVEKATHGLPVENDIRRIPDSFVSVASKLGLFNWRVDSKFDFWQSQLELIYDKYGSSNGIENTYSIWEQAELAE